MQAVAGEARHRDWHFFMLVSLASQICFRSPSSAELLMVAVPLLLVTLVLYLMPSTSSNESIQEYALTHRKVALDRKTSFVVVFDASSSGSHIKPSLSAYAQNPRQAVGSLIFFLLDKAESVVPREFRPKTPVRVGATAGLRALERDAFDSILQAVRDLLKQRSTLKFEPNAVTVLDVCWCCGWQHVR
ncbi:Apyrase 1 [Spatholobus suberectus]|nr:Apyrase 1 [Spatholobus suberectus]